MNDFKLIEYSKENPDGIDITNIIKTISKNEKVLIIKNIQDGSKQIMFVDADPVSKKETIDPFLKKW